MYKPKPDSCDWGGWCLTVCTLRGRPVLHTVPPLVLVTGVAVLRTAFSELDWVSGAATPDAIQNTYSLLLVAVSFLLVFRINRAAVRFYDARAAAGKLIETCRTLAGECATRCAHDRAQRDELCRWIVAYPVATRNYLRKGCPDPLDRERELEGVLSREQVRALQGAAMQPLLCLDRMRLAALRACRSNCFDAPPVAAAGLESMERHVSTLCGAMGAMERINSTPLPFAYVAHLRSFLVLYLAGMPFVFGSSWGWWSPSVTIVVAFALLEIEAAAVACERPFGTGANHMPLDLFCDVVHDNVAQILRQAEGELSSAPAKPGPVMLTI